MRTPRLLLAAALAVVLVPVAPLPAAAAPTAHGQPASASSTTAAHPVAHLTDGDQSTYWESASGRLPQWATVDLGAVKRVDSVTLKLPKAFAARTQTLAVQGSLDGGGYATFAGRAEYTFDPAVTIEFPAALARFVRIDVTANSAGRSAQLAEVEVGEVLAAGPNLALGKAMTEKSHADVYPAGNANDGNQSTYWESANNAFPQWIQVDLGAAVAVNQVVLSIPPGWGARSQTLSVQGSTNGSAFTDIVASGARNFAPKAT
ncbi:MAG TPA: discoidin domain-containing protein, partial [Phytomonospora sp.]